MGARWLELVAPRREDLPPRLHEALRLAEPDFMAAPKDPAAPTEERAVVSAARILSLAVEPRSR